MSAFDVQLGKTQQPAGGANITLVTANAVSVGGFIELMVVWFGLGTLPTLTITGGGLTYVTDQALNTGGYGIARCSAQAPAGLAASTSIQVAFSATPGENYVAGWSMTGVATSAAKDVGGSNTDGPFTTWDAGLVTSTVDGHISASAVTNGGVGTASPGATYTEVPATAGDFSDGSAGASFESIYRVGVTPNTYSPTGTFTASGTFYAAGVAYKDSTGPAPSPVIRVDWRKFPKRILARL